VAAAAAPALSPVGIYQEGAPPGARGGEDARPELVRVARADDGSSAGRGKRRTTGVHPSLGSVIRPVTAACRHGNAHSPASAACSQRSPRPCRRRRGATRGMHVASSTNGLAGAGDHRLRRGQPSSPARQLEAPWSSVSVTCDPRHALPAPDAAPRLP
jgi:hypothetical protein